MKSFGLALNLKDDPAVIEKYKEYHRNVWPDVVTGLRKVGIDKMRIFLLGRRMFMYIETADDFEYPGDFVRYMEQTERAQEWDDLMVSFQEKVDEAKPDELWAEMEQVYDLDW